MRNQINRYVTLGLLTILFVFAFAGKAQAVPAFARQMGTACSACHYQSYPALNSFGRMFRSKGYTMGGMQKMIEGEDLSIPSNLNASVITKIRYQDNSSKKPWIPSYHEFETSDINSRQCFKGLIVI